MDGSLRGIDDDEGRWTLGVGRRGSRNNLLYWYDRPEYIRDHRRGNDFCFLVHHRNRTIDVEHKIIRHRHCANNRTTFASNATPWKEVCVVLEWADENLIARIEYRPDTKRNCVQSFRHTFREHGRRRISVNEVCNRFSRIFVGVHGRLRHWVQSTTNVRSASAKIRVHRVESCRTDLCGCRIIEIHDIRSKSRKL